MTLPTLIQSPRGPAFVQDPYPFYARARAAGPLFLWQDYGLVCAPRHAEVSAILRDPRFGREVPPQRRRETPPHLAPFQRLEDASLLELEPPAHTRLRSLVVRAFTSARVRALRPGIEDLAHGLIDRLGPRPDLIADYAEPIPVITIARMMGLPDAMAPRLLAWSHAMVAMYQARRDEGVERAAGAASAAFTDYLREEIARRRRSPGEDLLSALIAAHDRDDRLSEAEMISTAVLLLNAGHEATVHAIGNGLRTMLATGARGTGEPLVEEVLRHDPPLHLFTRFAKEDAEIAGHVFEKGQEVGLLLAAAGRDPALAEDPDRFDPERSPARHMAFGAGIHFCVGAPLARAEIEIALRVLFERLPGIALAAPPRFADRYHFRGLEALEVAR